VRLSFVRLPHKLSTAKLLPLELLMHKIPLLSLALLAGARAAAPQVNPCTTAPYNSQPWCDTGLPLDQRIADLVGRIPNNLKPGMLSNSDAGTPGGPLSPYQWWNEGLHGVADSPGVNFTAPTSGATSFPQVITTAASFDVALFEAVASTISTEARVFNNNGNAGETFWTPNINIFRDPRWGRGQETPGEDPFLSAEYAAHFIKGFQQGEDPRYLKASACAKHFTAYDLENWNGTDRFHFNAVVSQQDLADTINVPFQSAVERGQVSCVMCSYQETNGVPSCADENLLTDLLKDTWGFGSEGGYIGQYTLKLLRFSITLVVLFNSRLYLSQILLQSAIAARSK
jgi:Glycosyl hydrolase family 3 N terminal domain